MKKPTSAPQATMAAETKCWIKVDEERSVILRVGYSATMPPGAGWEELAVPPWVEAGYVADGQGGWMPPPEEPENV